MKNWSFLTFMAIFIFASGCAQTRPIVSSTCKLDDQRGLPATCKEGESDCFVCRTGPVGNIKQIMQCSGGKWVEKGTCGNCLW